jgi:HAE1 family hydrophobic/amphiphilic exporter-1
MNICGFSVKRPVAMTCLILVMLLFGINAYRKLGLDYMPNVEIPFVTVTTLYPGASPEEIEVDVARRIEDAVATVDGIKHVNSTCMENVCITLLEFNLSVDVDVAATDVRERIDLILNDFPVDVESPKILKFDPNAKPVVTLSLSGNLPLDKLYDYADDVLSSRFSTLGGVGEVQISGGEELEAQVVLDEGKLAAAGITPNAVVAALSANNVKIPAGRIRDGIRELNVTFDAEFNRLDAMGELEIGHTADRRIYLRDVAEIVMQSQEKRTVAYRDGLPAVNLKIVKKGDANAVAVVDRVRTEVERLRSSGTLPGGMRLEWFTDDGEFIRANVRDSWSSIFLGVVMTAVILFLFLHEVRSTVIVALSMPVSMVVTFAVLKMFDYTFNIMTLLSLGMSVGILVTNSIVVIENIFTHLQRGQAPGEAADRGGTEMVLPVFASAMTNVVVFVPIALMGSLVGRFFRPFAVTMTVATLVSLFISFTLTPILAAVLLRREMPEHTWLMRRFVAVCEGFYARLEQAYARTLDALAPWGWLVVGVAAVMLVLTMVFIAPHVGMAFFPESDRGEFIVKAEFPAYYNLEASIARTLEMEKRIRALPEVLRCSTVVGKVQGVIGQSSEGVYLAEITARATEKTNRTRTLDQMRAMFREALADETDAIISVGVPSPVGGAAAMLELEIAGDDLPTLEAVGKKAVRIAQESGLATDVDSSVRLGKPEIRLEPRRPVLQNLGISAAAVGTTLRAHIEGIKAGTFKVGDRSFDIRILSRKQEGVGQVENYTFTTLADVPLNMDTAGRPQNRIMPIQINRAEKRRIVKIFANPAPGVALGTLVSALERQVRAELPPGYSLRFTGQVERMRETQSEFIETILLAILLTYLLIAAVLESWGQPWIIMATLPLGLIGMLLALFLAGQPLSMMGLLGGVMLIGIVVNNAILIMDEVIRLRAGGMPPGAAMLAAAKSKFRPIVMTSLAAIIGILPMAFGTGLGSEMRQSCGVGIVGGLLSSTLLSLFVIPLLYIRCVRDRGEPAA